MKLFTLQAVTLVIVAASLSTGVVAQPGSVQTVPAEQGLSSTSGGPGSQPSSVPDAPSEPSDPGNSDTGGSGDSSGSGSGSGSSPDSPPPSSAPPGEGPSSGSDADSSSGSNDKSSSGGGSGGSPTGINKASYYDPGVGTSSCGNNASNGDMVAAINGVKSLGKCGASATVTNTENGKSVTVTIIDECPVCGGFKIDLSQGAFEAIGDPTKGILDVKVVM
ncbi:hypothetical protein H4219_000207 [Mycoemilia scoparia]|uniref:RlpA-like protein double-psi beta-barrel domain-containing protein n=1 Tax=Mycoemilia scoparia TaxID=417184 RepID=A0A9W8DXG2_9FUNG|nr:hypothetical protein H4219_000207 [Mycoemilia scoparia]